MSSFFGLNIAKSGLFAAQKSLNTVSHNISNVNTRGYSRQRVELSQSNPLSSPGGTGMIGTGVDSKHVTQIRNEFLDVKYRSENTVYGQWNFRNKSLEEVEAIMNEPGDSGIRKVMDDFFSSFEETSKDPSAITNRTIVRERAIAFTNSINQMHSQFDKMIKDTDSSIEYTVNQINTYANDLAHLNNQIYQAELGGSNANDLRDQRNVLLDDLSGLVDVEITEVSQGNDNLSKKMKISINGQPLVSHDKVDPIIIQKQPHKYKDELGIEFDVRNIAFKSGSPINTDNIQGTLKAQIDMRDNINDVDGAKGIPYYMKKLDEFVNRFAAELDVQHFSGYGLDSAGTGNMFFKERDISKDTSDAAKFTTNTTLGVDEIHDPTKIIKSTPAPTVTSIKSYIDEQKKLGKTEGEAIKEWEDTYKGYTLASDDDGNWYEVANLSAKDFQISSKIEKDVDYIAVAKKHNDDGEGIAGDNSNMSAIWHLKHDDGMFTWGSPDDFVTSLVANLGVEAQESQRMTDNQAVLINQIDSTRQSISGVSIDEEMSNMIKFQHAYNASARMITAVDEMIDVIVNRMGRVGL